MKSILSSLSSRLKPKKKAAIAPCDCRDFFEAVEFPPDVEELKGFVRSSRFPNDIGKNSIAEISREHGVRSLAFDLRYRCGGEGRCICAASPSCRFPTCFTMRPMMKGAEIKSERYAFESKDSTNTAIRALLDLAHRDQLEKAVEGVKHLVDVNIMKASGGRMLSSGFEIENDTIPEFIPGASKTGSKSSYSGVNPLSESEALREEVVALYLWRAALLVNLRCDDAAVSSLLNLANLLDPTYRTGLYESAAKWAVLNDMEVIYYRALLGQYQSFPQAEYFARERPLLLHQVFECIRNDDFHTQHCTNVVLAKEVMAAVSRAQTAQTHGDSTEDPMKSLCLPLAIHYYRFQVGEAFWKYFLNLLCMPPLPSPDPDETRDATELEQPSSINLRMGPMPHYIFDAFGRSMILHHLIIFADTRKREIDSGVVVDRVKRLKALGEKVHPHNYDYVLNANAMRVAVGRLRELLVVANWLRENTKEEIGEGAMWERPESLGNHKKEEEKTQQTSSVMANGASSASNLSEK
ncbi:unnamed protein product [Phytomonas sp. Hart1]|nr:unnamed protein product [Phytomonas sp. Hart1]|eukprot:CCW69104.1 unnamed protein product [Phytomonas sp. isolate Hart1]